jgi:hypothetical protein
MRSRFRFSCSWLYKLTLDLDDGKLKWLRSSIHRALATSYTQAAPLSDPDLRLNLRFCESRVGK